MAEPLEKRTSDWTRLNHRLIVVKWPDSMIFTVQSKGFNLEKGTTYEFMLSQIALITGNTHSESYRFLMHCLSFYRDEELLERGRLELETMIAGLKGTESGGQPDPTAN